MILDAATLVVALVLVVVGAITGPTELPDAILVAVGAALSVLRLVRLFPKPVR